MIDLRGKVPESWHCVDCDFNTAPGMLGRAKMEEKYKALEAEGRGDEGISVTITHKSEVYTVRQRNGMTTHPC